MTLSIILFDPDKWTSEGITAAATIVIAAFTIILAFATFIQAILTRSAISLARAEFNSTHRPKLVVRELLMLPGSPTDRSINVRYVIANVGASKAEIVESWVEIEDVRDGSLMPLQPFEGANPVGNVTIDPGAHIFREQGSTVSNLSIAMAEMISARGKRSTSRVFFRGFIIYTDQNGIRRRTGFCRAFDNTSRRFSAVEDADYEYAD